MRGDLREPSYVQRTLVTGAIAGVATSVLLAAFGRRNVASGAAPLNAVSHSLWGEQSHREAAHSMKYTATGTAVHFGACAFWAGLHEALYGRSRDHRLAPSLGRGASTAFLAYFVDYWIVPRRFTPGFESRLMPSQMASVYGLLAVCFPLRAWLAGRRRRRLAKREANDATDQTQRAPSTSRQTPLTMAASSEAR